MGNSFRKFSILLITVIFLISFSTAAELATSINPDTGLESVPYEDGDTVQGTVNVQWTQDDPDDVLPCGGCTGPTQLKWEIWMTYQDSNGNWYTEQVGETSFGPGDSRKEGDNTDETINSVTISTENNVDTSKYNQLAVKPILSSTTGTGTDEADRQYLMSEKSADDGGGTGGSGNTNPVPKLDVPSQVQEGNSFTADASASNDPDGSIESYDWDWTDDGTYENYGALKTADHFYMYPGTKTIRLRVKDDDGATSTVTKDIEVTQDCPEEMVGQIEVTPPAGFISYPIKAALWNKDPSGTYEDWLSGCNYNSANPNGWYDLIDGTAPVNASANQPKQFVCENGTTNQLSGYDYPSDLTTQQENYWLKAEDMAQEKCQTISKEAFNVTGETAPVTQYYIPLSAIPTGEGTAKYVSTEGDYKGIITHDYQSLYNAMKKYDGGDNVKACEYCEQESTWLDKNMSATQAYANNSSDSKDGYENAWVTDNMGAGNERNIANSTGFLADGDKNPQDGTVFPGGYAGNCQGILMWQLSDSGEEWECSSNVNPTQEIFLPTFDFPSDEQEMVRVGFHIMPQLFNTSTRALESELPFSFSQTTRRSLPEVQKLDRLNAVCWWGDANRYSELKYENVGQTWFTVVYRDLPESPENPIPVHGVMNASKRADYGGGPSCRWSYAASPAVRFADEGLTHDPYVLSGTVTNIASNAQSLVDERNYTASSINLQEDYTSPMNSNDFRDVSFEWQNEAGYTRYDSASDDDAYLDCVPNNKYFKDPLGTDAPGGCMYLDFIQWQAYEYRLF